MKLKIKKFDCSKLTQYATVMCIGKRGTGKTTLIRDIMSHMADRVDFGIAMCGTEETAKDMGEFIPPSCIYNEYSAEALDVLLKHQKKTVMGGAYKKTYLIMDDTLYDKAIMKSKNMRMLFMNGRHRKIFYLAAVQYLMDLPPDLRANVDFVFALKENIIANREKLWKNFFGMFHDYKDFSMVMNSCTAGYDCMVLDNTVRSNCITDCVFWYRADRTIDTFHVGSPGIWKLHDMFYKKPGAVKDDGEDNDHNDDDADNILDDEDESVLGVADQMAASKQNQKTQRHVTMEELAKNPKHIHIVEKRESNGGMILLEEGV